MPSFETTAAKSTDALVLAVFGTSSRTVRVTVTAPERAEVSAVNEPSVTVTCCAGPPSNETVTASMSSPMPVTSNTVADRSEASARETARSSPSSASGSAAAWIGVTVTPSMFGPWPVVCTIVIVFGPSSRASSTAASVQVVNAPVLTVIGSLCVPVRMSTERSEFEAARKPNE